MGEALTNLGVAYLNGRFVTADINQSVEWLEKAVDQGHTPAMVLLGQLKAQHGDLERDFGKRFELCERAAHLGNTNGQICLADLYARGWGVEQDPKHAYMWASVARSGMKPGFMAVQTRGLLRRYAKSLTPAQISEAVRLARESAE